MEQFAQTATILAIVGLVVSRGVDLIRTAFDKHDSVPKAWWLIIAHALGIGVSFAIVNIHALHLGTDLPTVLAGLGFGSVAGFWHEVLSALSARSGPAAGPKGLIP